MIQFPQDQSDFPDHRDSAELVRQVARACAQFLSKYVKEDMLPEAYRDISKLMDLTIKAGGAGMLSAIHNSGDPEMRDWVESLRRFAKKESTYKSN